MICLVIGGGGVLVVNLVVCRGRFIKDGGVGNLVSEGGDVTPAFTANIIKLVADKK